MSALATPSWVDVLDAMELRVRQTERILSGEIGVYPEHFVLPDGLGPMPPDLAPRAAAILEATLAIEDRVAAELAETANRLSRISPETAPLLRPEPRYFDRTA